jgi:two-component system sensor histidine kinase BaeS
MKIGITYRLFFAILTATVLAVVCMFLIMQWSIDRGFLRYVNSLEQKRISLLVSRLEERYAQHGNWNFLRRDPPLWDRIVASTIFDEEEGQPEWDLNERTRERPPGKEVPTSFDHPRPHIRTPYILLDAGKAPLLGPAQPLALMDLTPIRYKNLVVGYLGRLTRQRLTDISQLRFVREQKLAMALVAATLLLLTAGLSLPLARRLVQPILELTSATKRLAAGEYRARVPDWPNDELGRLARDFNTLALALEKNDQARRQWVADISHELRTPLAVLRGEVEALQDGLPPWGSYTSQSTCGRPLPTRHVRLGRAYIPENGCRSGSNCS